MSKDKAGTTPEDNGLKEGQRVTVKGPNADERAEGTVREAGPNKVVIVLDNGQVLEGHPEAIKGLDVQPV